MYTRRAIFSALTFLAVFIIQEALFTQVRFPLGGFSLLLIFALCWAALSTPEIGAITGFGAGFLLDLSPSSGGPVGQWTLVLILVSFGVAFLRYGDESLRVNPLSVVLIVTAGVVVTLIAYLLLGALLGVELGTRSGLLKSILGNGLWTLIAAPFVLPVVSRIHSAIFKTRESI
jgi:rod shape-determining protein MreD